MIQQIDSFNYRINFALTGNAKVYFDTETKAITVVFGGSPTGTIPSNNNRAYNAGQTIVPASCTADQTLEWITAINAYPFAEYHAEENSPSCYVPPPPPVCDIDFTNVIGTAETSYGANDCTITVIATSSHAPIYYSLDGANFGVNSVFQGLAPGTYTVYIQDSAGCQDSRTITVAKKPAKLGCTDPSAENYDPTADIDNGTCVYPTADDAGSILNLYEKEDQFRLVIGGQVIVIREPMGWDKVSMVLKRDKDYHGVDFEFTDGDIMLQFTEVAGCQAIYAEYLKKGSDANVQMQFGFMRGEAFILDFDGYLDFNAPAKITDIAVECPVKRKYFDDTIETRMDTPVTLTDSKTIDGEFIAPAIPYPLQLHSKAIIQKYITDRSFDPVQDYPHTDRGGTDHSPWFYIHPDLEQNPDTTRPYIDELKKRENTAFGVYREDPLDKGKFVFDLLSGGPFKVDIEISLDFTFHINPFAAFPGRILKWSFEFVLNVNGDKEYSIGTKLSGLKPGNDNNSHTFTFGWSGKLSTNLDLKIGDKVYIFGRWYYEADRSYNGGFSRLAMKTTKISIVGITEAPNTPCKAFFIHETVQQVLASISNKKARLYSDLLGREELGYDANGCGSRYAITNGYQIRQFEIDKRPVIINYKDLLESINAWFCVGTANEIDAAGNTYVRLERFDYFYQDVEIMSIDAPSKYREEVDKESIYNEIEVGYAKYPEDDITTLDEPNTKHKYATPIVSYKGLKSIISKIMGSGYALELTRRMKFEQTEADSWKYDEENFVIALRDAGVWEPEKNQAFERVENFLSPETAYNLRLSPKRMLYSWAKLLNTSFVFKKGYEAIKNTFYSKNGEMITQFKESETCSLGDPDKLALQEKAGIYLHDFDRFDRIFSPEKIYFDASLNYDQIRFLKRCHQNRDNSGKNYGYIRVKDNDGNYKKGYLTQLTYNPVTEMASFVLRKKYANLSDVLNCSDYADYTFSQFEATTGLSPEIEQCKFNDFE